MKYKDDGREFVSVLEFITIHCTFPLMNAWVTEQLFYQISSLFIQTCPFSQRLQPNYFWCAQGYIVQTRQQYQYSLFNWFAYVAYSVITCENLIYLAYYKDVIFSTAVILEYSSMYYWSKAYWSHQGKADQPLTNLQLMVIAMIVVNSVSCMTTLAFNYNSAFYLKARQLQRALDKKVRANTKPR